jgi:hypothetical protein
MTDLQADTAPVHIVDDTGAKLCETETPAARTAAPAATTITLAEWTAGVDANRGARVCPTCSTKAQAT